MKAKNSDCYYVLSHLKEDKLPHHLVFSHVDKSDAIARLRLIANNLQEVEAVVPTPAVALLTIDYESY